MFNIFKRKNIYNSSIHSTTLSEDNKRNILGEERYNRDVKLNELNNEYKMYTSKKYSIIEELMYSNLYSKAINEENIFNEYSKKYIDLCNQLLQLLPKTLEYDRKEAQISKLERNFNYCYKDIVNMIRLLEKQEKYNEIINVCKYLLSLGITEDGTKKGIKGRIEKAIENFNNKFNTNFAYDTKKDLIIDNITGEIMYASIDT